MDARSLLRTFDTPGVDAFRRAESSGLLAELTDEGKLIPYEWVDEASVRSPLLPFVSYPYEWPAELLRDAALLTLDIAIRSWDRGLHLRDASAFNIVPGPDSAPVFVDLGSFGVGTTPLWNAYGQFCDHFLSPLLIHAYAGVPWQSLLGSDGVDLGLTAALLKGRHLLRKGVFRHVRARHGLEQRARHLDTAGRSELRARVGLDPAAVRSGMVRLKGLIEDLDFPEESDWTSYELANSYDDAAARNRDAFLLAAASGADHSIAVDVGTNTGRHAGVLAGPFERVVAIDADPHAVDRLYGRIRSGQFPTNIHPVVANVLDPAPPQGFRSKERPGLTDRISGADLYSWMAVLHHLVLAGGLSLEQWAAFARELGTRHVVEFVHPEDPMAQLLSAAKGGIHHPYSIAEFEQATRMFRIEQMEEVTPTRTLYLVQAT